MATFTAENFINAIGGPDKLTEVCIDKGGNFLAGKVTTGFQKVMTTDTKTYTVITKIEGQIDTQKRFFEKDQAESYKNSQEADLKKADENAKAKNKPVRQHSVTIEESTLPGAPAAITGIAANTLGMMGALAVGPEMISALVMEATNVATTSLSEAAAKIVEAPIKAALEAPKKMKEQMQKTFDEEKTSLAAEMKKFNSTAEERIEEQEQKQQEETEKSHKNSLNAKLSSLNTTMAKATTAINDKVGSIAKYMAEGPDWVSNQISKAMDNTLSQFNNNVDNICNDIKGGVTEFAETQGKAMGNAMAKQYNKIIENQAKKIYNMMEENKSKAKIKAFTALQKGKLKIMALTGINIPM